MRHITPARQRMIDLRAHRAFYFIYLRREIRRVITKIPRRRHQTRHLILPRHRPPFVMIPFRRQRDVHA